MKVLMYLVDFRLLGLDASIQRERIELYLESYPEYEVIIEVIDFVSSIDDARRELLKTLNTAEYDFFVALNLLSLGTDINKVCLLLEQIGEKSNYHILNENIRLFAKLAAAQNPLLTVFLMIGFQVDLLCQKLHNFMTTREVVCLTWMEFGHQIKS